MSSIISPQPFWPQRPISWKTILSMNWGWQGMVLGWFKCITFIVHFISNLMLSLIWAEVPVCGLEVGDPLLKSTLTICFLYLCTSIRNSNSCKDLKSLREFPHIRQVNAQWSAGSFTIYQFQHPIPCVSCLCSLQTTSCTNSQLLHLRVIFK